MRRALTVFAIAALSIGLLPTPAFADFTYFFGYSPKPTGRPARGFALGVNMIVVGFEFEYASTDKVESRSAPGLKTFMLNGLLMTPTSDTQLYVTAGAGFYREYALTATETTFGTNVGGGLKMRLVGPLRLRVDYRVFALRGQPVLKTAQRFYAGANVAF